MVSSKNIAVLLLVIAGLIDRGHSLECTRPNYVSGKIGNGNCYRTTTRHPQEEAIARCNKTGEVPLSGLDMAVFRDAHLAVRKDPTDPFETRTRVVWTTGRLTTLLIDGSAVTAYFYKTNDKSTRVRVTREGGFLETTDSRPDCVNSVNDNGKITVIDRGDCTRNRKAICVVPGPDLCAGLKTISHNGRTYAYKHMGKTRVRLNKARDLCNDEGGYLPVVLNEEMRDALGTLLEEEMLLNNAKNQTFLDLEWNVESGSNDCDNEDCNGQAGLVWRHPEGDLKFLNSDLFERPLLLKSGKTIVAEGGDCGIRLDNASDSRKLPAVCQFTCTAPA